MITNLQDEPQMSAGVDFWELRLYVAGQSPKSLTAQANLRRLCEENRAQRLRHGGRPSEEP